MEASSKKVFCCQRKTRDTCLSFLEDKNGNVCCLVMREEASVWLKPIHIREMYQSTEKGNRALVIAGMQHTPNYLSGTSVTHDLRL